MPSRPSRWCAALITVLLGAPPAAHAQAVLGVGDDATTVPAGALRIGVSNIWTRFDDRFDGTGGLQPLGAQLTSDAAGVTQFENLAPVQANIRALSGLSDFAVSIGRTALDASELVRTTPISAEVGLTHWLQLGVMVPVVSTRMAASFRVNSSGPAGNVGINPALTPGSAAATANAALLQQFADAEAALSARITACTASPGDTNCATVLATGPALLETAQDFATGIAQLYGSSPFVPLAASSADAAIRARVAGFAARFGSLGSGSITAAGPASSQTPAGVADIQRFVTDSSFGLGNDSLQTVKRIGLGDIELSAKIQWLNTLGSTNQLHPSGGVHLRSAVAGVVRFGTGSPSMPGNFLDVGTGDGQTDIEVRSQNDVIVGRWFWASIVGRYGTQLADSRAMRIAGPDRGIVGLYREFPVQRDLGDYFSVAVTPRVVLGSHFSFAAQYQYWHKDQDHYTGRFTTTDLTGTEVTLDASVLNRETRQREQRVSAGLVYSTVAAYADGRAPFPIEISFQHAASVAGEGGRTPNITRDAIQIRLYTSLFGGPLWGRR
jgi:hypothetical protein